MTMKQKISSLTMALDVTMMFDIALDQETPCGMFESDQGDRYLVIEDEEGKLAIALRHRKRRPFFRHLLSQRKIATGNWLGNCELQLTHRSEANPMAQAVGTLGIDEGSVSLLCRQQRSNICWRPLARIPLSDPLTEYDGWRLMKAGCVFHEQLPGRENFPTVLPMNFAPLT